VGATAESVRHPTARHKMRVRAAVTVDYPEEIGRPHYADLGIMPTNDPSRTQQALKRSA
jgi:hypothetical protein